MPESFLAFDLGAESGRAVIGQLQSGTLQTTEVHRFANEPVAYGNSLHWDILRLWLEMRRALKKVGGVQLEGVGVDTWAIDYALLDDTGELLGNPYHYRDGRTSGIMQEVFEIAPPELIYRITGIQFLPFNTLFQLFAAAKHSPRMLQSADRLLTIPDLLNFWLSGNAVSEFTNATTTQMLDAQTSNWAKPLLQRLSLPSHILAAVCDAGTILGSVLPCVASEHTRTPVIAPACHDTGSAVAAISAREDTAFLSSGTWSLLGMEVDAPIITDDARMANFTNEGGVCGTTRFLKNVMGLWLLQRCRETFARRGNDWAYDDLTSAAAEASAFRSLVNPDDPRFLNPTCMVTAIEQYCCETNQPLPDTPGACVRTVLESLALRYSVVLRDLERLTGGRVRQIRVIGGGSCNDLLNQFTADATGCTVLAGPAEATALGNIMMQMLATGAVKNLQEGRELIDRSYPTRRFQPRNVDAWEHQKTRFKQYCEEHFA
ncbi:MAG: rhamnulokinase [Acidobacteriaceae bacterium]|nr:rhamnulokinase [Acidobacteriaceae bacterium]